MQEERSQHSRFQKLGFTIVAAGKRVSGALVVSRYRIQRSLGWGGIGRTYLVADEERSGTPCVLKEFIPDTESATELETARQLFMREAQVLQQLNHSQIPKFLDWFAEGQRLFLVQGYIEGKNYHTLLDERRRQRRCFSPGEVVQWLRDLLPVLDYIHRLGIVHRDLSPDNIILPIAPKASKPMLIDFGAVTQIAPDPSSSLADRAQLSFAGKVGYSPPEQIRGERCDPRSDLYSLAVTALVLLTGKSPSDLFDSARGSWNWHSETVASDRFAKVLDKMLAEHPQDRYPSAAAVLRALSWVRWERGDTSKFTGVAGGRPPRYNYRGIAIASIALTLFLGAIAVARLSKVPNLCKPLNACAEDREFRKRYEQILRQGLQVEHWVENAPDLEELRSARTLLQRTIVQLAAIPESSSLYAAARQTEGDFRDRLRRLNHRIATEQSAARQLAKIEAIASHLVQNPPMAKPLEELQQNQAAWERLLKQLDTIPVNTLVAKQSQQRRREYERNIQQLETQIARMQRQGNER